MNRNHHEMETERKVYKMEMWIFHVAFFIFQL